MNIYYKLKVESCRSSGGPPATSNFQPATFNRRAALTLLEMMVAVTLLAVIMVGLLAMFQYTQRALHAAHMQTDVFENARAAIQLVTRDISEMSDYGESNYIKNFYLTRYNSLADLLPPANVPPDMPTSFDDAFWLTQVNDKWQGLGYFVDGAKSFGVGTLYRFSQTTNRVAARGLYNTYTDPKLTDFHRVSDGIVHFQLSPVYAEYDVNNNQVRFYRPRVSPGTPLEFPEAGTFASNMLPAFIDLEIGVLEPATLKLFNTLTNSTDTTVPGNFLLNHVGKIHFFRERVPIHNFINPYRADEVQ